MQNQIDHIMKETIKLSRLEKIELLERLVHHLKIEESPGKSLAGWGTIYGIGKGVWDSDAQVYVNESREDRSLGR